MSHSEGGILPVTGRQIVLWATVTQVSQPETCTKCFTWKMHTKNVRYKIDDLVVHVHTKLGKAKKIIFLNTL